jgi:hypothetical protein
MQIVIGVVAFIIILWLGTERCFAYVKTRRLAHWLPVQAEVLTGSPSTPNVRGKFRRIQYTLVVNGERYGGAILEPGNAVTVRYPPQAPEKSMIV